MSDIQSLSIVDVVKSYGGDPKPQGALFVDFCMFHNDVNTPNMFLYPANDTFYCYSCKMGGNVFKFIAMVEGVSYGSVMSRYRDVALSDKLRRLTNEQVVDFSMETRYLLSDLMRTFMAKNPHRIDKAMHAAKKIDLFLAQRTVSYRDGRDILRKLGDYFASLERR